MTTAISKTQLNNIENMLSNVENKVSKVDFSMDKATNDFKKAFDKSVDKLKDNNSFEKNKQSLNESTNDSKINQDIEAFSKKQIGENNSKKSEETVDIVKTLNTLKEILTNKKQNSTEINWADLKEKLENSTEINWTDLKEKLENSTEINWADLKEELEKISEEARIEMSLDLTLSKDINEIITQLKDAIDSTKESIENIEEAVSNLTYNDATISNENTEANTDAKVNTDAKAEIQNVSNKTTQALYEQILTLYNKLENSTDIKSTENSSQSTLLDFETLDVTETIELTENTIENVINKSSEQSEETDLNSLLDDEILKDLKIESVKAETNTSSDESFMQQESPEEIAVKAMINKDFEAFEVKIEASQSQQMSQPAQAKTVEVNPSRILEQITKQLDGLLNGSKVNIVLNPESLGKVNIQLLSTKEGLMAQLTVTTQEAKDILMKGLDGLKDSLLAHGVNADNVSIKVADSQKTEYNEDWTEQEGSRGGNKGQKEQEKEEKQKGLFEQTMAQTLEKENGNV